MQFSLILASLVALTAATPQDYALRYFQPQASASSPVLASKGGEKYLPPATTTEGPILHKQFYSVSAPNESDNKPKTKHLVLGRPQQNYRVIFVKAPESENANVKYSAEFAPQEEKTVIYVLSKKDNELNAQDISTPAPTQPSKPEVFFIKYKTPEEAEAAQNSIKNQYKDLGGTDEETEQASAPVASVVGSLDGQTPDGGYDYKKVQGDESSLLATNLQRLYRA